MFSISKKKQKQKREESYVLILRTEKSKQNHCPKNERPHLHRKWARGTEGDMWTEPKYVDETALDVFSPKAGNKNGCPMLHSETAWL